MTKEADMPPTVEGTPHISEAERRELRASLDGARADIAAGNFDVVTSETLRAEFEGIFYDDKSDEELDAHLTGESALKRSCHTRFDDLLRRGKISANSSDIWPDPIFRRWTTT